MKRLIILIAILLICFAAMLCYKRLSPVDIKYPPSEYVIAVSKSSVTVKLKYSLSIDCKIDGVRAIKKGLDYHLVVSRKRKEFFKNLERQMSVFYVNSIVLSDLSPGHNRVFCNNLLLGEFEWPIKESKYIFSNHPYIRAKEVYSQANLEFTDHIFYQKYWIDQNFEY